MSSTAAVIRRARDKADVAANMVELMKRNLASDEARSGRLGPGYAAAATATLRHWEERATELEEAAGPRESWGRAFVTSRAWKQRRNYLTGACPLQFLEERADAVPRELQAISRLAAMCTPYPSPRLSVEWPRFTGPPHPAMPQQAEGDLKEQVADGQPEIRASSIRYVAGWIPVTRQALDDADVIRAMIDTRLRQSLAAAVDNAIITALNSDEDVPEVTGPDMAAAVAAAAASLLADGYGAPVVIANPADAPSLYLRFAEGPRADDLVTFPSHAVAPGTAIVASLSTVLLASKGVPQILVTDSHAGEFLHNRLTILAEQAVTALLSDPWSVRAVTTAAAGPAEPESAPASRRRRAA